MADGTTPDIPKASDIAYTPPDRTVPQDTSSVAETQSPSDAHPVSPDNHGRAGRRIDIDANLEAIARGDIRRVSGTDMIEPGVTSDANGRDGFGDNAKRVGNTVREKVVGGLAEGILHADHFASGDRTKHAVRTAAETVGRLLPEQLNPAEKAVAQAWDRSERLAVLAHDPQLQQERAANTRWWINHAKGVAEGFTSATSWLAWLGIPFTAGVSASVPISGETIEQAWTGIRTLNILSKTLNLGWHLPSSTPDVKKRDMLKREGVDVITGGLLFTAWMNAREQAWHDTPKIDIGKTVRAIVEKGPQEYAEYASRRDEIDAAIQKAMEWKVPKDAPRKGRLPWGWSPKRDMKRRPFDAQLDVDEQGGMRVDPLDHDLMK